MQIHIFHATGLTRGGDCVGTDGKAGARAFSVGEEGDGDTKAMAADIDQPDLLPGIGWGEGAGNVGIEDIDSAGRFNVSCKAFRGAEEGVAKIGLKLGGGSALAGQQAGSIEL